MHRIERHRGEDDQRAEQAHLPDASRPARSAPGPACVAGARMARHISQALPSSDELHQPIGRHAGEPPGIGARRMPEPQHDGVCQRPAWAGAASPAARRGKASASERRHALTSSTWCNTRAENSADDSAHSGETKTTTISASAPQPARASAACRATNGDRQRRRAPPAAAGIGIPARPEFVRDRGGAAVGDHGARLSGHA